MSRPTWIFDPDQTSRDASPHIFPRRNRAVTERVMRHAGLDEDAANALRRSCWRRYGAPLSGLVRHHGADPYHFPAGTHRFPGLPVLVRQQPGLRASLARLPGHGPAFSNLPLRCARAVLGVAESFDAVFTIEHTGFRPEPEVRGFRESPRCCRLVGRRRIVIEDATESLRTATRLGMTMALITARDRRVWHRTRWRPAARIPTSPRERCANSRRRRHTRVGRRAEHGKRALADNRKRA